MRVLELREQRLALLLVAARCVHTVVAQKEAVNTTIATVCAAAPIVVCITVLLVACFKVCCSHYCHKEQQQTSSNSRTPTANTHRRHHVATTLSPRPERTGVQASMETPTGEGEEVDVKIQFEIQDAEFQEGDSPPRYDSVDRYPSVPPT